MLILLLILGAIFEEILQFLANSYSSNARVEAKRLFRQLRSSANVTKATPITLTTLENVNDGILSANPRIVIEDSADSIVTGSQEVYSNIQSDDPLEIESIASKPLVVAEKISKTEFLEPIPPIQEQSFEYEGTKELNTFIDKKIQKLWHKVL